MTPVKRGLMIVVMAFLIGWLSNSWYTQYTLYDVEKPLSVGFLLGTNNLERYSPKDHINEDQIHVTKDKIVLDIKDAMWSSFADTNSMDPAIDEGSNGIEIQPSSENDIKKGDIISFKSESAGGLVIHRVIEIGSDEHGWYARTKGDNNPSADPGKVRFNDINGVLVGIIY